MQMAMEACGTIHYHDNENVPWEILDNDFTGHVSNPEATIELSDFFLDQMEAVVNCYPQLKEQRECGIFSNFSKSFLIF